MTEEEKITETEKSREKYFYIDKEKTYQVITGIVTSFIGAGLALVVFTALHKPPVPPCPMFRPQPCPMRMAEPFRGQPPMMMPPKQDFRGGEGFRFHKPFKGHWDMRGKDVKRGKWFPPKGNPPEDGAPIPTEGIQKNTPKK